MNDIKIFNNNDFGEIKAVDIDGEAYVYGNDVANALGYIRPGDAILQHVDEEDKKILTYKGCSKTPKASIYEDLRSGENDFSNKVLINESGIYDLVFNSKLPSAKKFKRWVTSEVLPSIRKNGVYATDDFIQLSLDNPDYAIELLQSYKKAKKELEANKPKVEYCDNVLKAETLMPISKFCKDFGYSAPALNKILNELGVQFKMGNVWCLYAKYADKGYAHTTTFFIEQNNKTSLNLQWTEKGRNMIHDLLEKNGLLKNKIK